MIKITRNKRALDAQAYVALTGADYVRDKFLSLLTLGPTQDRFGTYAVKCRIKKHSTLLEKVSHRKKTNKSYSPENVTDIVGLRLIALHSDDVLIIFRAFLDFIRLCQNTGIELFHGVGLKDTVREVLIYRTSTASIVYDAVHSEAKAIFGNASEGVYDTIVEPKDALKVQPYSSVHIVCDAISHIAGERKVIPVEVQIRTVLEDYWAEVDHPMRYKGPDFTHKIGGKKMGVSAREEYETLKNDLVALKIILDSCGQNVEGIKSRFETIKLKGTKSRKGAITFVGPTYRSVPSRKYRLDVGCKLATVIDQIDDDIKLQYKGLTQLNTAHGARAIFKKLGTIIQRLEDVGELYKNASLSDWQDDADFRYYQSMELGVCRMWRYKVSTEFGLDWFMGAAEVDGAIKHYRDLVGCVQFSNHPVVYQRLAHAAFKKDQYHLIAIELLEQAIALYGRADSALYNPFLRIDARKELAYYYWKYASDMKSKVGNNLVYEGGSDRISFEYAISLMSEVIEFESNIDIFESDYHESAEKIKTANNFISYTWEYIASGGELSKNQLNLTESISYLERNFDIKSKYSIMYLDSLLKGWSLIEHDEKIGEYAPILMDALNKSDLPVGVKMKIRTNLEQIAANV